MSLLSWATITGTDVTSYPGFWTTAAGWALLLLVIWGACWLCLVVAGCPAEVGTALRRHWSLKVMNLAHHAFVGPLALIAVFQDPALLDAMTCIGCHEVALRLVRDSAEGPSSAALALVPVTIGYMLADLLLVPAWELSQGGKLEVALMLAHHSISMLVWPFTLHYDYCARYVVVLCSYEVSSIAWVTNWMLMSAGLKETKLYLASGLAFTFLFVVVRLLSAIPQLAALWSAPPWTDAVKSAVLPDEPFSAWKRLATFMLVVPHILNFFWGYKVVRGFLNIFRKWLAKQREDDSDDTSSSSGDSESVAETERFLE